MIHSLCVTFGLLWTYKLYVHVYGRKSDKELDHVCKHTGTTQKWINLFDKVLDTYKGKGCCITMESVYKGDILAQVGHYEWLMNMLGTAQANRT